MSERIRRSGTSSALSLALSAATRMRSHAASKLVEPPHGAACSFSTFSRMVVQPERSTQRGSDSKVSTRCRNASHASSDTSAPRPMAASIGRPVMLPLTSTSATSLPRSTLFGSAARSAARSASPAPSPAASRTAASRAAAAVAIASRVPSRSPAHCACISSPSSVLSAWRPAMHLLATSCGISCLPLTAFFATASRRCLRAATRPGSSGWRLPVSSCAACSFPLSASLRNALRQRWRQSDETWANSISAKRLATISTSVVLRAAFSLLTSLRYLRLAAASLTPKRRFASALATPSPFLSKCEPSRGAYLPHSDSLGVRFSASAACSSAASALSWSAISTSAFAFTAPETPATS
mmetsp:Transcript_26055/g.68997  ORF Transcript_26055/g.68997 Transcript_26055/m.68997 type:complete len:354 (-) Transcript_26055:34-1095(-)